jgi:chemotaxis protein MotB
MFERGSAIPSAQFRTLLRKIGPLFSQVQNQMLIVGHTDGVQYASTGPSGPSNWKLSTDRAMAARTQLIDGGMPVNSVLQVVGMADRAPFDPKSRTSDINRRIELLILTTSQAQAIAAMFGKPKESEPLLKGVDTSLNSSTLDSLRVQLRAAKDALNIR